MRVELPLRGVDRLLGVILITLFVLGLAAEIVLHGIGDKHFFGLVPLLNLSFETNLPTWYSSVVLLACATLLASIGWARRSQGAPYVRHWLLLAVLFLYISLDETIQIHEHLNDPIRESLELSGGLYFAWVLPVGGLLVILGLSYLGFLRHLDPLDRRRFVVAGIVYVGGAMGTEFLVSAWYADHGGSNLVYGLINLVQESLEILGASMFLSALLAYIGTHIGPLRFRLGHPASSGIAP